jgi:hypothetical protein
LSGERFPERASKGVELYSWKTTDGGLRFSLLWGTNRNKTDSEIRARGCTLPDVASTKAAFGRLAKGERVFWANDTCPRKDCTYPSDKVIEDLRAHAKSVEVTLAPR